MDITEVGTTRVRRTPDISLSCSWLIAGSSVPQVLAPDACGLLQDLTLALLTGRLRCEHRQARLVESLDHDSRRFRGTGSPALLSPPFSP